LRDLAKPAGDRDTHCFYSKYPGSDLNAGILRSLSDNVALLDATGQSIAKSGSSHAMPKSFRGE
jgi:hypothetical protein